MSSHAVRDRTARLLTACNWLFFTAACLAVSWAQPAWDLTANYIASRLVWAGNAALIYGIDQDAPHGGYNAAWVAQAASGHVGVQLTSYRQTPLLAWLLSPVAGLLDFASFRHVFACLCALAAALTVHAAARTWFPRLAAPGWQALLLAGLLLTVPFDVSLVLGQTHILFLLLAVLGAALAIRGRPWTAGFLLATAACVKISPAWIAVSWLAAGRMRAVAGFAVFLALETALSVAVTGVGVFRSYLATLHETGSRLLLSFNNDSLATVLQGGQLSDDTAFHFQSVAMQPWATAVCTVVLMCAAVTGGLIDRRANGPHRQIGAIITLVAATVAMPLAWNHYFIVLILPVMLFLDTWLERRSPVWLMAILVTAFCVEPPAAYTVGAPLRIVGWRSECWAALFCGVCACVIGFTQPGGRGDGLAEARAAVPQR